MRHLYSLSGIVVAILLFAAIPAAAQRQYNIWYFGTNAGVDFNNGSPIPLLDGQVVTNEGSAVICDPATGTLLFYTDGRTVWNRSHLPMPNGTGLLGHTSTAQAVLIVPLPGSTTRYLVFTLDANESLIETPTRYKGLNYSIVDMTAVSGMGNVVVKNTRLEPQRVAEKLCGIKYCRDGTYWVIVHEAEGDAFYAHHVTAAGVGNFVISRIGRRYDPDNGSNIGCLAATRDGRRLADGNCFQKELELFDFDPVTGVVSNRTPVTTPFWFFYGVCFSPDGTKLYTHEKQDSARGIYRTVQYDLRSGNPAAISATRVPLKDHHPANAPGHIELAPNGKLYIMLTGMTSLDEIADPNISGTGCNYTPGTVVLEREGWLGLPSSIPSAAVPVPTLITKSDIVFCVGDSVSLEARDAVSYNWYPADGLSCTDCPEPIASPRRTTTYHVAMRSQFSCLGRDTLIDSVVVIVDSANVNVIGGKTICRGDTAALSASGGLTYRWSPADGLSCTDCPAPLASPKTSTSYTVIGTNVTGCSDTAVVRVDVIPIPILGTGPTIRICAGESIPLIAEGAATYRWSPADGLNCTDCAQPIASPRQTTTYHVEMTAAIPCNGIDSRIDSVTVVVDSASLNVSSGGEICLGDSMKLHADGGVNYRWSPAEGLSCTDCPDPLAYPTKTTNYYVSATTPNGCVATAVVWVGILSKVEAGPDTTICFGESVQLQATGSETLAWSPADGLSCTDCPNPNAAPTKTTTYHVRATSAGKCRFASADSVTIIVRPPLPLDAGNDVVICRGETARLRATGVQEYRWSPAERISCTDCPDPEVAPVTTTTYYVTGIAADGCTATDSVTVTVVTRPITFTIGRDHHTAPGGVVRVPITVDDPALLAGVDTIVIGFGYHTPTILPRGFQVAGTMLDGWRAETIADSSGGIVIRFVAAGTPIRPANPLAQIEMAAFLGDSIASELPLLVEIPGNECLIVSTQPGRLRLDSVCGLSMRLIELNNELFLLKQNVPNPFNPVTEITFSIGLDGPALLRVFDIRGNEIARPVDGSLSVGEYTVTFDAGDLPSGMYIYKLESSGVTRTRWMTVVK